MAGGGVICIARSSPGSVRVAAAKSVYLLLKKLHLGKQNLRAKRKYKWLCKFFSSQHQKSNATSGPKGEGPSLPQSHFRVRLPSRLWRRAYKLKSFLALRIIWFCLKCALCGYVCVCVGVLNVDFCPLIAKSTRPLWSTKFRELRTVQIICERGLESF